MYKDTDRPSMSKLILNREKEKEKEIRLSKEGIPKIKYVHSSYESSFTFILERKTFPVTIITLIGNTCTQFVHS